MGVRFHFDEKKFSDTVRKAAIEGIKKKIRNCRCLIHGEGPKVEERTEPGGKKGLSITACCESLMEQVRRELR